MRARALEKGGQPTEGTSWGLWCFLSATLVRDISRTFFFLSLTSERFLTDLVLSQVFR